MKNIEERKIRILSKYIMIDLIEFLQAFCTSVYSKQVPMFCNSYSCSIFSWLQCVNLERISEYFICTYVSKNTFKTWKNLEIFVMVRWSENQFFTHTIKNGKYYNHNLKMDLLWSRPSFALYRCWTKELYFFFGMCHLNWLLIFTFSCKSSDRKRAEGQSQPSLYSGQDTVKNCLDAPFPMWKSVRSWREMRVA